MAIIKEWLCVEHGPFEGSHPICPGNGCESDMVTRAFYTAPGIRSDFMKNLDAGIKKSADGLNLTDLRSAKAYEAAHGGSNPNGVLWGNDATKFLGKAPADAVQPFSYQFKDGKVWNDTGGMRQAANEAGITKSVLPRAEITTTRADTKKLTV